MLTLPGGGVDLLGIFTGALSYRRLAVILNHLPPESRFRTARVAAMSDEEKVAAMSADAGGESPREPRSQLELLTARTGDLIQHWMWSQADAKKRGKAPAPFFAEDEPKRPVRASTVAYLQDIREKHARRREAAG